MAGFVFTIGSVAGQDVIAKVVHDGNYAVRVLSDKKSDGSQRNSRSWKDIAASVLADYCSMKAGDNVYFLSDRCVYGVGVLVNIQGECKYNNYPSAYCLQPDLTIPYDEKALDGDDPRSRWVCFFKPGEEFYRDGVDMDEILSYKPEAFRMLRALEGRSFIKVDDEENAALKEFIYLKRHDSGVFEFSAIKQETISRMKTLNEYRIELKKTLMREFDNESGELYLESMLEAAVVDTIQNDEFKGVKYDYVNRQVIASPFKPLQFIDKIDVLAYKYLHQFPDERKPVEQYLIIELKKGKALKATISQTMRYVDWVCKEYASGNYSRIKAYIIAHDYNKKGLYAQMEKECKRYHIVDTHPIATNEWTALRLLKYQMKIDGSITFDNYDAFNAVEYIETELKKHKSEIKKNKGFTIKKHAYKPLFANKDAKIAYFLDAEDEQENQGLIKEGWHIYNLSNACDKEKADQIIQRLD